MVKAADIYLEQFARLGVFSKVEGLAAAPAAFLSSDSENSSIPGMEKLFCCVIYKLFKVIIIGIVIV